MKSVWVPAATSTYGPPQSQLLLFIMEKHSTHVNYKGPCNLQKTWRSTELYKDGNVNPLLKSYT